MSFSAEFTRKYEVLRVLGEGGMGRVYLARERELSRLVAIKFLHMAGGPLEDSPERFLEEARICAKLKHPNLAKVLFADTSDGLPYIVFEFVEGYELAAEVKARTTLPPERALSIVRAILEALSEAHQLGIVHRDVKPSNVLLRADNGEPMLMDFGVARAQAGAERQVSTQAGVILGTPTYMAPEVITGEPPAPAADVYAVGCMLFELLTGAPPFLAATDVLVLSMHVHHEAPSLATRRPELPPALVQLVDRALAKDPAARFADARAMLAALDLASPLTGSGSKITVPQMVQSRDAPPPAPGRATAPMAAPTRPVSRPDPASRPRLPSNGPRSRGGAPRPAAVRRLVVRALAFGLIPVALVAAVAAWILHDAVTGVALKIDDSGTIEASWTSRRADRGQVAVLPASRAASLVTSAETIASTAHLVTVRGLPKGLHHVAIIATDGRKLWSAGVEVPARGAVRTERPRAPGGPWEVTAPPLGAAEGHLIVPSGSPERVRSAGVRDGKLWFEYPFPAGGPPAGTRVSVTVAPGVEVAMAIDRAREVAGRLAERLAALPAELIARDLAKLNGFSAERDFMIGGRATTDAKFTVALEERLVRDGVWPLLVEFEPLADRFFELEDDRARLVLYEGLLKLEGLEMIVLSQRERVDRPVRRLYRKLVEVHHAGRWVEPAPAVQDAIRVQDGLRLWAPADYGTWDNLSLWIMEKHHVASLLALPDSTPETLRRSAVSTLSSTSAELSKLRAGARVEVRLGVAYLGPAYRFRVTVRGDSGELAVNLGHAGSVSWYTAMEGRKPDEVESSGEARVFWGDVRARFAAGLLPRGKLRVEAVNEHAPGLSIATLSRPIHRAALVRELSLRAIP